MVIHRINKDRLAYTKTITNVVTSISLILIHIVYYKLYRLCVAIDGLYIMGFPLSYIGLQNDKLIFGR